jgi:hypothetical protein
MFGRFVSLAVVVVLFGCGIFACSSGAAQPQQKVMPRRVQVDSDYDGKIDQVEIYDDNGQIIRVESDTTGDGKTDKWVYYDNGKPVKSEKDTNADGKPDVWSEF